MRAHLKLCASNETISFEHQHLLVGVISKWMGNNDEHGKISLYSFSKLEGGSPTKEGLTFYSGASFFISTFHSELLQRIIGGILKDPTLFNGLSVEDIVLQEDPDLTYQNFFLPGSPIFIHRRICDTIEHIRFDNPQAGVYLKETLLTKMSLVGLSDDTLEIEFDKTYANPKIRLINYKGVKNKANWCPVIIKGKPETKQFAWNVGLGNSTGIGFGAIK